MLTIVFEFIITLVILIGGGMLLYLFKDSALYQTIMTLVAGSWGAVTTYWFQRRATDSVINKMQTNDPSKYKNVIDGGGNNGQGA